MTILEIALSQYGITETKGPDHNPAILRYFNEIDHAWVDDDETAWCSAFANWVARKAHKEYSGKLNARSWLDVGIPVVVPAPGDIVVLWRGSKDSWKGHVGFFCRENETDIWILGGNQGIGQVNIRPYSLFRLLAYRRLLP